MSHKIRKIIRVTHSKQPTTLANKIELIEQAVVHHRLYDTTTNKNNQ